MKVDLRRKHATPFRAFVHEYGGQSKVAKLLGMSRGHISLIYNGKRRITVGVAEKIEIASKGDFTKEVMVFSSHKVKA